MSGNQWVVFNNGYRWEFLPVAKVTDKRITATQNGRDRYIVPGDNAKIVGSETEARRLLDRATSAASERDRRCNAAYVWYRRTVAELLA